MTATIKATHAWLCPLINSSIQYFVKHRMQHSEKLCLKWNDFQENLNSAFEVLRNDKDFADVTLACEDGTHIEAHKVILASSSPFLHGDAEEE